MELIIVSFFSGCLIGICLSIPFGTSGLLVLREAYDRGSDAGYRSVGAPLTFDFLALVSLLFLFSTAVVSDEALVSPLIKKILAIVAVVVLVGLGIHSLLAARRPSPESPVNRPYFKILLAGAPTALNVMVSSLFFIKLFSFDILTKGNCAKIFFLTGAIFADFCAWVGWIWFGERMRVKRSFNLSKLNTVMAIVFFIFAARIIYSFC